MASPHQLPVPDPPYMNVCMTNLVQLNILYCFIQEVEELFSGEGCPKYISCEPAHNNYWYIQFESEDCAQKVCEPLNGNFVFIL